MSAQEWIVDDNFDSKINERKAFGALIVTGKRN